jgi:hypothetical protein
MSHLEVEWRRDDDMYKRKFMNLLLFVFAIVCQITQAATAYHAFASSGPRRSYAMGHSILRNSQILRQTGTNLGCKGSPFIHQTRMTDRHSTSRGSGLMTMKDQSIAYWFKVGDEVQVVEDVYRGGSGGNARKQRQNVKGLTGTVTATFEKCDVDPTCCCAEFVDRDMAVTVLFPAASQLKSKEQDDDDGGWDGQDFTYYFAEEELKKVVRPITKPDDNNPIPFDGMSCTDFKLQKLQEAGSNKPRRIASYEPSTAEVISISETG